MINDYKLPEYDRDHLFKTGLSATGNAFLICFIEAEQSGRGVNNREVLAKRLRMATPEQRAAALDIFDGATKKEGV
jgi:hypothetical protein